MEYTGKEAAVIYNKIYKSHKESDVSMVITNGVLQMFKSKCKEYPSRNEWATFLKRIRDLVGKDKVYSSGGTLEKLINA